MKSADLTNKKNRRSWRGSSGW